MNLSSFMALQGFFTRSTNRERSRRIYGQLACEWSEDLILYVDLYVSKGFNIHHSLMELKESHQLSNLV